MLFYSVERCQILECEKDLLLKVNYMVSVTKRSYVKMFQVHKNDHCGAILAQPLPLYIKATGEQ
jgi:hypothetical protein